MTDINFQTCFDSITNIGYFNLYIWILCSIYPVKGSSNHAPRITLTVFHGYNTIFNCKSQVRVQAVFIIKFSVIKHICHFARIFFESLCSCFACFFLCAESINNHKVFKALLYYIKLQCNSYILSLWDSLLKKIDFCFSCCSNILCKSNIFAFVIEHTFHRPLCITMNRINIHYKNRVICRIKLNSL